MAGYNNKKRMCSGNSPAAWEVFLILPSKQSLVHQAFEIFVQHFMEASLAKLGAN
jgi:hypothetical protein